MSETSTGERATAPAPRICFYIPVGQRTERGYIPSVVTEGESGHSPMLGRGELAEPWYWGQTYEQAVEIAERENERLGLSLNDVAEIIASSISTQIIEDDRRRRRDERMERLGLRRRET